MIDASILDAELPDIPPDVMDRMTDVVHEVGMLIYVLQSRYPDIERQLLLRVISGVAAIELMGPPQAVQIQ